MLRVGLLLAILLAGCSKGRKHDTGSAGGSSAVVASLNARVTGFWTWFVEHAQELRVEKDGVKAMQRIGDELAKIDSDLIAEIGVNGETRELVISADGHKELFPRVQEVYAARPAHVEGWAIVAFRQRDPRLDGMSIELNGKAITAKDLKFVATPVDGKLDIQVFIPGFTTNEEMGTLAYVILDHTIGEYDMETKIGVIDLAAIDNAPSTARPLDQLPAAVDALPLP